MSDQKPIIKLGVELERPLHNAIAILAINEGTSIRALAKEALELLLEKRGLEIPDEAA